MEVVFLKQSDATSACGVSQTVFQNRIKPNLKMEIRNGKKLYALPVEKMTVNSKEFYKDKIEEIPDEEEPIESILGNIDFATMPGIDGELTELQNARLQEILARTKWIEQKLEKKKQELFSEWSEKFFMVFSREFSKFKNTLIDLRLEEKTLNLLKENLEFAISNLEESLNETYDEYMNKDEETESDI